MSFPTFQIHGLSDAKFNVLLERLGHNGFTVCPDGNSFTVTGPEVAGKLSRQPGTTAINVELQKIPALVTPGYVVGRLYDEILVTPEI